MSSLPDDELSRLRAILDALTDPVVLCKYDREKDDARCLWCNRATLHATGLSREEIIGSPPRGLLPLEIDTAEPAIRRMLFERVMSEGHLELEHPMVDASLPSGTMIRVRVYSLGPETDSYVVQTEMITPRDPASG